MDITMVVIELRNLLGAKLTAYIGRVDEIHTVSDWASGTSKPSGDVAARLEFALEIARIVTLRDNSQVAQAWFSGQNEHLLDVTPARAISRGDIEKCRNTVLGAARSFAAGGD
ncbi:MAG: hypothetical protein NVSMB39_3580 [Candidatus Saccharimonadales bacterium]